MRTEILQSMQAMISQLLAEDYSEEHAKQSEKIKDKRKELASLQEELVAFDFLSMQSQKKAELSEKTITIFKGIELQSNSSLSYRDINVAVNQFVEALQVRVQLVENLIANKLKVKNLYIIGPPSTQTPASYKKESSKKGDINPEERQNLENSFLETMGADMEENKELLKELTNKSISLTAYGGYSKPTAAPQTFLQIGQQIIVVGKISKLETTQNKESPLQDEAVGSEQKEIDLINPRYWYQGDDISEYMDMMIKYSLGGYRKDSHFLLAGIGDGCYLDEDGNRYWVAVMPAINTVAHADLDRWLDKSKQPAPDSGKRDDRRDVWDEIMPVISKHSIAHVKMLFGYNDIFIHWLLGEIQLHKKENYYMAILMAHDPYGGGEMDEKDFVLLSAAIKQGINQKDPLARVEFKRQRSPHGRRQSQGDLDSCGVIVSEDMVKRISGASLDQNEPYPIGVKQLRKKHLQLFKEHLPEKNATRRNFIKRITQQQLVSIPESQILLPFSSSRSEKNLLDLTKIVSLISAIQHDAIKQRIVEAITHRIYHEDENAYRMGIETALLQWPVKLLSQGEGIEYQDKVYLNELYYHLFLSKEGFRGKPALIHSIATQLSIDIPEKWQKKGAHPLALPLAQLYQRLAFIRLPVFTTPQPLCHSYVHLMLINQHANTARPGLLTQSSSEVTDHLSTPWLNRYRSYEDIYHRQKAVVPEILCQDSSRAIVIGRAGVGKSTFCRYGLYRWSLNFKKDPQEAAQGLEPWWTQYDLVFWIPLHSLLNYQPASKAATEEINEIDLAELILHLFKSQLEITEKDKSPFTHEALVQTLQMKTLKILYLLDGFDEAERLQTKNSYDKRLLNYLLQQDCYVLTSRPHALEGAMRYQADQTSYYELMGFANEDIPEYVTRAFKLNGRSVSEGAQLLERLKTNITMWTAAHTPIQLALLCSLWKDDLIPRHKTVTMTGLYTIMLERLLAYNIQQLLHSSSLEEGEKKLIGEQYKGGKIFAELLQPLYTFLSKLAFVNMMQDTLILSEDFVLEHLDKENMTGLKKLLVELGYKEVQLYETPASLLPWVGRFGILHAISLGDHNEYEFIHLTFQEYLAAYYLAERFISGAQINYLDKANIPYAMDNLIPMLAAKPEWQITLSFLAGQLYARSKQIREQKLVAYMTLLAEVPELLVRQVTPYDKRFNWAQLLLDFSNLKVNNTDITSEMIRRVLLLAYSLEECELADISQKQHILEAMNACGTRALLLPRHFPAYSQERVNLVHTLKLCQQVFAACGLRELLQYPEKEGISLPQTLYLAQAALLQITERSTLGELITLLQKALDSNLRIVQLQIMDDILQGSTTYTHLQDVVFALGLCLCSNHIQVADKARVHLEEITLSNKSTVLIRAASLNLSAKDPLVKRRAALVVLQNDFYALKAWQSLVETLSPEYPSFLDELHLSPDDSRKIDTLNSNELPLLAGRTLAWLLVNNVSESIDIVFGLLTSVDGLLAIVQSCLIERSQRKEEAYIKLRIIELFEKLNPFDDKVFKALIGMLSEVDTSVRKSANELLEKIGKTDSPEVIKAHTQNLNHSDPLVRQAAVEALGKLEEVPAPEVIPTLIKNLSDSDAEVKRAAASKKLDRDDRLFQSLILKLEKETGQDTIPNASPNDVLVSSSHTHILSKIQNSEPKEESRRSPHSFGLDELDQEQIQRYSEEFERKALSQSKEINTSSLADELIYPNESDDEEDLEKLSPENEDEKSSKSVVMNPIHRRSTF